MNLAAWIWVLAVFAAYLVQFAPVAEPLIRRAFGG